MDHWISARPQQVGNLNHVQQLHADDGQDHEEREPQGSASSPDHRDPVTGHERAKRIDVWAYATPPPQGGDCDYHDRQQDADGNDPFQRDWRSCGEVAQSRR